MHLEGEEQPILILNYLLPPHLKTALLSSDLYSETVERRGRAKRRQNLSPVYVCGRAFMRSHVGGRQRQPHKN